MAKMMSRKPRADTEVSNKACEGFVSTVVSMTGLTVAQAWGVLNFYLHNGWARVDVLHGRVVASAGYLAVETLRKVAKLATS